jgi:hypothetical protein
MSEHKLPRCWIGHPKSKSAAELGIVQPLGEHTDKTAIITEDDCNPDCHCHHPMQAHFCMEGHMTECHAGMSCEEARCSHYESREQQDEDVL